MIDKVIAFALGGVAGYFVGRYLTKNFYKEKAEKEIADMEEYYQGKHPEKPPRETNTETVDGKKIFTMGGNYVKPNKVDEWDDEEFNWEEKGLKPGYARPCIVHRAILGSVERCSALEISLDLQRRRFYITQKTRLLSFMTWKIMARMT